MEVPGFVRQQCIAKKCGAYFFAPVHVDAQARANKDREIWCPGCGTPFVWRRNEADELREKMDRLERELHAANERALYHDERATKNWRTAIYWKGRAHRKADR